ncbi:hypothetical protein GCM10011609_33770 [Lentzea pudingi]|uniref:ANTAR domain-containing protein n=1 Tax=Lentzea pudingi TaxID=1789439 RepID=A0ABQ2HWE0_9PSEU|nr:hypothetical protein GCM10011609_33770 [Lentzea pudingi]
MLSDGIDGDSLAASAEAALLAFQLGMESEYLGLVGTLLKHDRWSSASVALRAVDPAITRLVADGLERIRSPAPDGTGA